MIIIASLVSFALGVVAVVLYNKFFPSQVAKATKELGEEVDKLREKTGL